MAKIGGLGKGVQALFQDTAEQGAAVMTLKTSEIEPNRDQPRKTFDEEALSSLASSIQQHGVLQPIVVRPMGDTYQIIAGERRWRASRMIGLDEIPVVIRNLSDDDTMVIALIENLQRENLNAIEEALGYQQLVTQYGMSQEQVAERVGKSRSTVANSLRLLNLPPVVWQMVREGDLSAGHARALLSLKEIRDVGDLAREAIAKGWSVREMERRVRQGGPNENFIKSMSRPQTPPPSHGKASHRDHFFEEMEVAMRRQLHRKIKIESKGGEKGTLQIDFFSKQELNEIAMRLAKQDSPW